MWTIINNILQILILTFIFAIWILQTTTTTNPTQSQHSPLKTTLSLMKTILLQSEMWRNQLHHCLQLKTVSRYQQRQVKYFWTRTKNPYHDSNIWRRKISSWRKFVALKRPTVPRPRPRRPENPFDARITAREGGWVGWARLSDPEVGRDEPSPGWCGTTPGDSSGCAAWSPGSRYYLLWCPPDNSTRKYRYLVLTLRCLNVTYKIFTSNTVHYVCVTLYTFTTTWILFYQALAPDPTKEKHFIHHYTWFLLCFQEEIFPFVSMK